MEKDKKRSLFKNNSDKDKPTGLRTGRNTNSGKVIKKSSKGSIPKENPLLSQAPEGSKTWNAFRGITKITHTRPQDYIPKKDDSKKSDYINFRNW